MLTFSTLKAAIDAGFHVVERTPEGYTVRQRTAGGYALAFVVLK
jgi:hypothetical protein